MAAMSTAPLSDTAIHPLREQVLAAAASRTPLRIRGGGSKEFHNRPLDGALLDTRSLRGIRSYEPSELVVTVAAGTPLAELEAALAEKNQCLPFEPPHFQWSTGTTATVGGMVASGLAGPARASVGGVRDYVLGLQLLNGKGEHLTFGGQVMKNVAGYDVSRLMVGAWGTLGLITEVSLKVLPRAPAEATLVFALGQSDALEHLHRWGGQPLPLNASCWTPDGQLRLRLRGAAAAVEAACQALLREVPGQRVDASKADTVWAQCRNQTAPFFQQQPGQILWRLSVPQTAPVLDLPAAPLVEWHGGLRWLWAPPEAGPALQAVARQVGGNATVFVADGAHFAGVAGLFSSENPALDAMARRLKASFDPHGVFNPALNPAHKG